MDPSDWWANDGGREYTARNRVDWRKRVVFMRELIHSLRDVRSVYEVGCNAGWNLSALVDCYATLAGCDINHVAVGQAKAAGLDVTCGTAIQCLPKNPTYDLVFTSGVLIHIPPVALESVMRAIIQASTQYVIAIEYADDIEREIRYRNQDGLLWARPYGKLYEKLGLKIKDVRFAGEDDGFDSCTCWVMERK